MATLIPKQHELDLTLLDNIKEEAETVDLNPSEHKSWPIDVRPALNLLREARFWGDEGIAIQTILQDPWNPGIRREVASKMKYLYHADPKVFSEISPNLLRSEILERGKPLEERATQNFMSYFNNNIEDILKNGRIKDVAKIVALLDTDYREYLKLFQDNEFDDMRDVLRKIYSQDHVDSLDKDDERTKAYFRHFLEITRDSLTMPFQAYVSGKVVLDEKRLIQHITEGYENLDKDDYPTIRFSIAERAVNAFRKAQEDKADDLDPDKDKEKDWPLRDI